MTEAAVQLKEAGLIDHSRGHIQILDADGLGRRRASATRGRRASTNACSQISRDLPASRLLPRPASKG